MESLGTEFGGLDVDRWEEIVWEHGFAYYTGSPGTILGPLSVDREKAHGLLDREQPAKARTELLRITARLTAIAAMEMTDTGHPAALHSWRTARRMADATGDRDLRVWVRGWEAIFGYWSGWPAADVIPLTDDAIRIAAGTPGRGLFEAHTARAFALAAEGDADGAGRALDDAHRVADTLPGDAVGDHDSPLWSLPAWAGSYGTAYTCALVGDTRRAARQAAEARRLCPPDFGGDTADLRLFGALALIGEGDVTAGLIQAMDAVCDWPVTTGRRRVITQLLAALPERARALPAAQALHRWASP